MFCLTLDSNHLNKIKKLKYIPVGLGQQDFSSEWHTDKVGKSISNKNPFYGEYTFHYWIWKNYLNNIDSEWVGFCQYRKFWTEKKIENQNLSFDELNGKILKEVPDNLWETCPKCSQMILKRELKAALYVCKHCDHHFRINAKDRLESFFGNNFMIIETPKIHSDPLKFKDRKKYVDRLKIAKKNTNLEDSVLVASGTLNKIKVTVAIFDFNFMGGSMGMAAGEAIVSACNYAKKNKLPLIIFSSSGGARMQEGILSLMQMPRTVIAINSFCKTNQPFLSILTDPTTGGVSASFAMLGDLILAEKNATIGFAGSRVIEETIKEKTFCCGGGGGLLTDDLIELRMKGAQPRMEALKRVIEEHGVTHMAAICAICKSQFSKAFQYYGFELDQIISLHNLVGDALIMNKKEL